MSKVAALILAAGRGSRMQSDCPKQFMDLCGIPVVAYSLLEFSKCSCIQEIVLVTGEQDIEYCEKNIIEKYKIEKVKKIVSGGSERYWSVWNGLQVIQDCDYVLIHDGARPLVTQMMIEQSVEEVQNEKACTVAVPVKDTIKVVNEDGIGIETPNRNMLWQIQTPQSFDVKQLTEAYRKMKLEGAVNITDDTMIMEQFGKISTKVLLGDYRNIKITTPEDFLVAESFLKNLKKVVDTGRN